MLNFFSLIYGSC